MSKWLPTNDMNRWNTAHAALMQLKGLPSGLTTAYTTPIPHPTTPGLWALEVLDEDVAKASSSILTPQEVSALLDLPGLQSGNWFPQATAPTTRPVSVAASDTTFRSAISRVKAVASRVAPSASTLPYYVAAGAAAAAAAALFLL